MALTSNNLAMIKAIAQNDIHAARLAALASLAEDKSKKNAWVADRYRKYLTGNASVLISNMPPGLQTILVGETPDGFDPERFYLREEDAAVYESICRMKQIAEEMAERNIPYRNTTLLYGKTGTGKTELGRYIACMLDLPFFYISFANALDSYMGNTAKNIRNAFEFCNTVPCVFMLDEVDCISMKRAPGGSKGIDGELERTTISLMQELDRLPSHVVIIAATNRPDLIDEALMRRFSIRHEVTPMSETEIAETATRFLAATRTAGYVSAENLSAITKKYDTPGAMMPELIRLIGDGIYEENKDALEAKAKAKSGDVTDLWRVRYTWETNIAAETDADAIALARGMRCRGTYSPKTCAEEYTAKRAEYIYPNTKEN